MRLSCPNCLTEYDAPEAALARPDRRLKCGHCGHEWRRSEIPVEPAAETLPAPTTARPQAFAPRQPRPPAPPPPRRSFKSLAVLFVVVVAVIIVLADHTAIARVFPASAKFFQTLGLK